MGLTAMQSVAAFAAAMKESGGIPREEKWEGAHIGTHEENLENVSSPIVQKELSHILELLSKISADEYCIIGGTALIAYVPYRATTDLDVMTYASSPVERIMLANYEQYRVTSGDGVTNYFLRGKHTSKVRVITVPFKDYDITWVTGSREVRWNDSRFHIPHIDRLIEMKRLSDRAVDAEDVQALEHWRKHWMEQR